MTSDHSFDTIILGGGAMGSASAWHLSARGQRVLVLDRHHPPHAFGSTHGETRVIREAYFEHPDYVPLAQRAYELWRNLEAQSKQSLLRITGGLMVGRPDGVVVQGALRSARQHRLPHEVLDARTVNERFPALQIPDSMNAVFEPRAGILMVESCVDACLIQARRQRAVLKFDEPAISWRANDGRVEVTTARATYSAASLVLSAGSWLPQLVPELAAVLQVERQVLHWFHPGGRRDLFQPDRLPVHLCEYESGRFYYAVPDVGTGLKAALHHQGESTTPETVRRDVSAHEQLQIGERVRQHLPLLAEAPHRCVTCLYTNTPDEHFLVDRHPRFANVLIVSPCSGHGFKFASALGELVADRVTGRPTRFDSPLFGIARLGCRWD